MAFTIPYDIINTGASDEPRTWGKMTDAEKGTLLLAAHEGKVIEHWGSFRQSWQQCDPGFYDDCAYRTAPPAPKRETESLDVFYNSGFGVEAVAGSDWPASHRITFDTIDGEPTTGTFTNENGDTVKIEEL